MLNQIKKVAVSSGLLVMLVMSVSGCVPLILGAAAGAGGYAWVKGSIKKEFTNTSQELYDAAIKGLEAIDVAVKNDVHDRLSAKIHAEFADGKKAKITITALTEKTTKIKIRVGILGNQFKSEMILNSIQKYL